MAKAAFDYCVVFERQRDTPSWQTELLLQLASLSVWALSSSRKSSRVLASFAVNTCLSQCLITKFVSGRVRSEIPTNLILLGPTLPLSTLIFEGVGSEVNTETTRKYSNTKGILFQATGRRMTSSKGRKGSDHPTVRHGTIPLNQMDHGENCFYLFFRQ